jgi:hypothetical protein
MVPWLLLGVLLGVVMVMPMGELLLSQGCLLVGTSILVLQLLPCCHHYRYTRLSLLQRQWLQQLLLPLLLLCRLKLMLL